MANYFKFIFIFCLIFPSKSFTIDKNTVETSSGKVEGLDSTSRKGTKFVSFLGIPYGEITARFQTAKMASKSDKTLKADKYGPVCVQWNDNKDGIIGEENCLYLNVFTPTEFKKHSKYPVMVYIHGGGFDSGASNIFGPHFLMNENIVLVTFNYRLGVLGFMNADDKESPGNVGLKDQVLALKWVKKNIKKFGGDPDKITVFGEGAGGSSVSYLIVSPMTHDLFNNAIVQSGSAFSPWAFTHDHLTEFKLFADMNNCAKTQTKDTITCLRETPLINLMKNSIDNDKYLLRGLKTSPRQAFRPSIENCKNCEKFLPKTPEKIYEHGHIRKVPLLIGVNKEESTIFTLVGGYSKQEDLNAIFKTGAFDQVAPQVFNYKYTSKDTNDVTQKIREYYFNGKSNIPSSDQVGKFLNDRLFTMPIRKNAILHSKFNKHTYLYYLDRPGEISIAMIAGGKPQKDGKFYPTNGDDFLYLFSNSATKQNMPKEFYEFSDYMVGIWTTFAKNDKPLQKGKGDGKEWEKVKHKGVNKWYHLNENSKSIEEDNEFTKRIEFWDKLNA